jgi:hypothetical protein
MDLVFPGSLLTRAKFLRFNKEFIKEDFPTFERPAKVNSGSEGAGLSLRSIILLTNIEFFMMSILM